MSVGAVRFDDGAPQIDSTIATNIEESLGKAMAIEGAFAVALIDHDSGAILGMRNTRRDFDIELAAHGHTHVIRANLAVMTAMGGGAIHDILINLEAQLHILRPHHAGSAFLFLAIDRGQGHLGMARHSLAQIDQQLRL